MEVAVHGAMSPGGGRTPARATENTEEQVEESGMENGVMNSDFKSS